MITPSTIARFRSIFLLSLIIDVGRFLFLDAIHRLASFIIRGMAARIGIALPVGFFWGHRTGTLSLGSLSVSDSTSQQSEPPIKEKKKNLRLTLHCHFDSSFPFS